MMDDCFWRVRKLEKWGGAPPLPKIGYVVDSKTLRGKVSKRLYLGGDFADRMSKSRGKCLRPQDAFASGDRRSCRWCTVEEIFAPIVVQVCERGTGKV